MTHFLWKENEPISQIEESGPKSSSLFNNEELFLLPRYDVKLFLTSSLITPIILID